MWAHQLNIIDASKFTRKKPEQKEFQYSIFKHQYLTMPKTTKADAIVKAAKELTQAIKNKLPSAVPATNMEAFMKLSSIFEEATEKWNENELL